MQVLIEDVPLLQIHSKEVSATHCAPLSLIIDRNKLPLEVLPWTPAIQSRFNMEDFEIESLEAGEKVCRLTTIYKLEKVRKVMNENQSLAL